MSDSLFPYAFLVLYFRSGNFLPDPFFTPPHNCVIGKAFFACHRPPDIAFARYIIMPDHR